MIGCFDVINMSYSYSICVGTLCYSLSLSFEEDVDVFTLQIVIPKRNTACSVSLTQYNDYDWCFDVMKLCYSNAMSVCVETLSYSLSFEEDVVVFTLEIAET